MQGKSVFNPVTGKTYPVRGRESKYRDRRIKGLWGLEVRDEMEKQVEEEEEEKVLELDNPTTVEEWRQCLDDLRYILDSLADKAENFRDEVLREIYLVPNPVEKDQLVKESFVYAWLKDLLRAASNTLNVALTLYNEFIPESGEENDM